MGDTLEIRELAETGRVQPPPWEFMNGTETSYIAARAEAVARQLTPCDELWGFSASGMADTQFNALMLCPPSGRGIATESRSAMQPLRVAVLLDTLRPTIYRND